MHRNRVKIEEDMLRISIPMKKRYHRADNFGRNRNKCQKICTAIDDRTKNENISHVRYYKDPASRKFLNSPIFLAHSGCSRVKALNLITIDDVTYIEKGRAGQPNWNGTVQRLSSSEACDEGSPEQRKDLHDFIRLFQFEP